MKAVVHMMIYGGTHSQANQELRLIFSHVLHLVATDPHEDPNPSQTRLRKIALGKKLLYAAQLGACESQQGKSAAADGADSAGAVALDVMGKVDALDGLLNRATETQVGYPEGRTFEDKDQANKV